MASINLRKEIPEPVIDEIIFGSDERCEKSAQSIKSTPGRHFITIETGDSGYHSPGQRDNKRRMSLSKDDIDHFIEALKKAKELLWV